MAKTSSDNPGREYEVGFGKPPARTQFKRGRSGNPKGRPPKSRNLLTLIHQELGQDILLQEGGKTIKLSKSEVLVKQLVNKAIKGDDKSIRTLLLYASQDDAVPDAFTECSQNDAAAFERLRQRLLATKVKPGGNG